MASLGPERPSSCVGTTLPAVSCRALRFSYNMRTRTLHVVPQSHALPLRTASCGLNNVASSPSASPPATGDEFGIEETAEGDALAAVMVTVVPGHSR